MAGPNAIKLESDDILINAGNQLQRLSISDGKSQWITTLPVDDHGLRLNHTVRDGENLLIGSDSGFLYVFDWQTGDLLWMGDLSGQLGLPWRPVTPLGVGGDMILVWISLADGDAVAGLRRGASPPRGQPLLSCPTALYRCLRRQSRPRPAEPRSQPTGRRNRFSGIRRIRVRFPVSNERCETSCSHG